MNKLYENIEEYFSSNDDLIIEPIDDKFIYITKEEYFNDIKSFQLCFDNGETIFINDCYVIDYFFQVIKFAHILDDPIFNNGFEFRRGCMKIDADYLINALGDDCFDSFIKKPKLNNIKVEYDNNYPIHFDIPIALLLPTDCSDIVQSYSKEDGVFIINWNYRKLM